MSISESLCDEFHANEHRGFHHCTKNHVRLHLNKSSLFDTFCCSIRDWDIDSPAVAHLDLETMIMT